MSTAVPPPSSSPSFPADTASAELLPGVVRMDRQAAPERRPSAEAVAPPQAQRRTGFRPDIEGLRGVAVLSVLAYHAAVPGFAGGYVGVDVFFVISGFLITGLLLGRPIGLWDFAARRARRILPAAATVLVATAVAGGALLDPLRGTDLARDLIASAGQVVNWRFVGQQTDYLAAEHAPSPLQHFWSLGVENQFYLLWGVLLLGLARFLHGRRRTVAITLATTAIGAVSLLLCVRWTATSAPLAYFSTGSRLWEFAAGACAALLGGALAGRTQRRGTAWTLRLLGWAGAAAVLASILLYDRNTPSPAPPRWCPSSAPPPSCSPAPPTARSAPPTPDASSTTGRCAPPVACRTPGTSGTGRC